MPGSASELTVAVHSLEDARDRDLARRVRQKDEDAFLQLFRRYGPIARSLALRVIRQPFMAEEIVQEAFLVLWRDPGSFREERGSFRSWLLSTVHHRAVDAVRREEAQRRRAQEPEPGAVEDVAESVVDTVDLAEQRARVREALRGLPAEQRSVLELMYFEGRTQSAIALDLDIPLGTVKSRTLLGMRRLRTMLVEEAPS
jgi:RNA polymerase sigma factor (sigma-70 family)